MDELKISKKLVIEAAARCSQAREVLKVLFPEVFDEYVILRPSTVIQETAGPYKGRGLHLDSKYEWSIVPTGPGCLGSTLLAKRKS